MKLRTRLVPLGNNRTSIDGKVADAWHDAMAAHALEDAKSALREEFAAHGSVGFAMQAVLDELDRRAAEILAGWLGEEAG